MLSVARAAGRWLTVDVDGPVDVTLEEHAAMGRFRIAEVLLHRQPRLCHYAWSNVTLADAR